MSARYIYCGAWSFAGEIRGIKSFRLNAKTGLLEDCGTWGSLPGQSILAVSGNNLAAVCELGHNGIVANYAIHPNGALEQLDAIEFNSAKLSYVVWAPSGKHIFVSSMGDGTVKMLRVADNGKLTLTDEWRLTGHSVTPRQNQAKIHSVMVSPDGSLLAAANLGADEVELFQVDAQRDALRLVSSTPVDFGREPRHMAFHPSGRFLYLLTEAGNRIYDYRIDGYTLRELAVYDTLDSNGPQTGAAADIVISTDGSRIYSTNRGQNNIAAWRVLPSGLLDIAGFFDCGGQSPRGLNLSPDGRTLLCANDKSGSVTVLSLNPTTGLPGPPIQSVDVPCAGCVRSI